MNIKEFKTGLPVRKAVLGIDYGSKRMGLAVSDLSRTIATPYKILYRREISADMAELRKIMAEKEIGSPLRPELQPLHEPHCMQPKSNLPAFQCHQHLPAICQW